MNHEEVKKSIITSDEWGLSQFTLSDLSAQVIQFNFVAHENAYNEGSTYGGKELPPTNHWTLFLTLTPNYNYYVHLEVAPNEPGVPGMLIVESTKNKFTVKTIKRVVVDAAISLTVADILGLIIQKKRDCYIYDPCGEGCRFWFFTVVDDFVGAGFMGENDARGLQSALVSYWPCPEGTAPVDRPMAKGKFPKLEQ